MAGETGKYLKFGGAVALILLSMGYLAYTGVQESKSYYVTIKELRGMGDSAYTKHLRVAGNVQPGSIKRTGTRVEFSLVENDQLLPVVYSGTEAPPDTFKDNSQALADGSFGRDGVFHAKQLQAKCASKYAPQQPGQPAKPRRPGRPRPGGRAKLAGVGAVELPALAIWILELLYRRASIPASAAQLRAHAMIDSVAGASLRRAGEGTRPYVVSSIDVDVSPIITLTAVVKQFGRFAALRGVSAEFARGTALCNPRRQWSREDDTLARARRPGAARPAAASRFWAATDLRSVCHELGYMAHPSLLYDEMSGMENLRYFARLYGID